MQIALSANPATGTAPFLRLGLVAVVGVQKVRWHKGALLLLQLKRRVALFPSDRRRRRLSLSPLSLFTPTKQKTMGKAEAPFGWTDPFLTADIFLGVQTLDRSEN